MIELMFIRDRRKLTTTINKIETSKLLKLTSCFETIKSQIGQELIINQKRMLKPIINSHSKNIRKTSRMLTKRADQGRKRRSESKLDEADLVNYRIANQYKRK